MVIRKSGGHKGYKNLTPLVATFLIVLFLSGCVTLPDPENSQEFNKTVVAVVKPGQTVGQTFVSRRSSLNGIDLWLQTDGPGQVLTVELYKDIGDPIPLLTESFNIATGKSHIDFPPRQAPPNQSYYLRLISDNAEIRLLGRDEDNYPGGTAAVNDQPISADLAFRATYDYTYDSVIADLQVLFSKTILFIPLCIVLFVPGWLFLNFTKLRDLFDLGEQVAVSLGLSLSFIPLLMLWTSFFGIHWGPISVWLASIFLTGISVWKAFKTRASSQKYKMNSELEAGDGVSTMPAADHENIESMLPSPAKNKIPFIILIAIFALTLFLRFAMVRDLASSPWVDSIHHALITRLMVENGGLPNTYAPYLPLEADYYHFGFHSLMATIIWLTGIEIQDGLLILGQVLNALMVFPIYLFVKNLTKNRTAGLAGSLIIGVFTLMPAYYTSWGRYTHLTGLLVLPVVFSFFTIIFTKGKLAASQTRYLWAAGVITLTGLFLIHYRVAAFLGLLVFAYLIAQINPRKWIQSTSQLVLCSVFGFFLLLPWLPGLLTNLLIPKGLVWRGGDANFSQIPWNFLKPGLGEPALVLAGVGLVLAILSLKRFPITVLLWTGMMYLLANLSVFGLPGANFVNPVSMEITLFMPISVLSGFAIGGSLDLLDKHLANRWHVIPKVLFVFVGSFTAILGVQKLLPTLNPITFLSREADFLAIKWIENNLPENEIILINPTGWGYGLYMGQDGGYWISPLTGHLTMPPAVLYGLGERNEIERINQFIEKVLPIGYDSGALWELMIRESIRFVYIGARGGVISPRALSESGLFLVRYEGDGTWVFETVFNSSLNVP